MEIEREVKLSGSSSSYFERSAAAASLISQAINFVASNARFSPLFAASGLARFGLEEKINFLLRL